MKSVLSSSQQAELRSRGFTRRDFGRIAALIAGAATLPIFSEGALAQIALTPNLPTGAVKIDSNEFPGGPCKDALEALIAIAKDGGRYHMELTGDFTDTLAAQEHVKPNYVHAFMGSSPALHLAVLAFTSKEKPLIMCDPGYEAGGMAARFIGSSVIKVPLTKSYAHDVRAMAAASPTAGLIYVVNPNNPTGTLTPREDIEWLVANKPAGSVILLDEAYIHFSGAPVCTDLVAQDKDIVILRTFSKIYGMAGLRAGAAIGRPDLLQKITQYLYAPMPTTAVVAATASLSDKGLVPERKKLVAGLREETMNFLAGKGYVCVPSVSNKFMVDVRRPNTEFIAAMRREKVYVGRPWPIWPTHVRISVGTAEEMEAFRAAFVRVMA
jgi:histidinol-phosphate/aromatic aminotransferase/cobyric acid decarboxylase-like protein